MIGLPLETCSSPCLLMISVPEAWQSPRKPGTPVSACSLAVSSAGKDGTVRGKYPQSKLTGTPAISQWPLWVSLPVERSAAAPYAPVKPSRWLKPAAHSPQALWAAAARPSFSRLGNSIGVPCSCAHLAMWPKVLAPRSPNLSASGAAPRPKESSKRMNARDMRDSLLAFAAWGLGHVVEEGEDQGDQVLGADRGVLQGLFVRQGEGRHAFGQVGDDRDAGDFQAAVAGRHHFRHHRHADHVGAQAGHHADLGGRLEVRAGVRHEHAFVQSDALVAGGLLDQLADLGVIGIGHAEEAGAEAVVIRADHRRAW